MTSRKLDSNIRHRRSIRLKEFNYAGDGMYYVTICTYGKRCILSEVTDERIRLSPIGKIISEYWKQISNHHTDVTLDEFVVMPNHVHGIIAIVGARPRRGTACRAPTTVEKFGKPRANSLPTIIRSFKSAATNSVNEIRNSPGATFWQRNYYEHIIRDERELNLIRQYIISNPLQWELDRENPASNAKHDRDEIAEILKVGARHAVPLPTDIPERCKREVGRTPTVNNDEEKRKLFTSLIHKVTLITRTQDNPDAALQTVCELLRKKVPHYDWVGFYLTDPNIERQLILGPFAGAPTDHVRIAFGEGICGQAADTGKTFIVPDVSKETNYLSCSPTVKSEIVLPIRNEGEVLGELDIDSHTVDAFSEEDRAFLLDVCCAVSRLLYRGREAQRKQRL